MGESESDPDLSRRNVRLGALVLLVLLGAVGLSLARGSGSGDDAPQLSGPLRESLEQNGCTVDSRADKGQKHVTSASYSVNPPAGGDHLAAATPAGFYNLANVPADGNLVHSLEHGFVVVWYRPDGVSGATVDGLRELARSRKWVLVVPRPTLPTALAVTAWRRRLLCPDAADALRADGPIGNFVTAFRNQGPEKGFV
ncbi:MAG TPA: DUF3105 domain-containing protein [Acidimicrobiia bacterium]|nr:DUF3105 domain-containing protein [Acidimicrobiia bacterium]